MDRGKIIKQISNDYTVKADKLYICKPRGKFRNEGLSPMVGDEVMFEDNYIYEVFDRKNELYRPSISNVDQAIIIMSLKQPDFSSNLLDKFLVIIEYNNIKPVIVFTKSDLLDDDELSKYKLYIDYYKKIGYEVYMNTEIDSIRKIFKGKFSVFTGQTGAGKSTLLNMLDDSLCLKTSEISFALNRGKHTTRHTEAFEVEGGLVADTPGFSALDFGDMSKEEIRDNFIEFNLYRHDCMFNDCMHVYERKCMIKQKVDDGIILKDRYLNYRKFIGE